MQIICVGSASSNNSRVYFACVWGSDIWSRAVNRDTCGETCKGQVWVDGLHFRSAPSSFQMYKLFTLSLRVTPHHPAKKTNCLWHLCFNRLVLPLPVIGSQLTCVLLSTVELSSADVHVEDRTGPELWKHCCHQASRADPSHSPPCWIAHQRGLTLGSTCTVGLIQAVDFRGVLS